MMSFLTQMTIFTLPLIIFIMDHLNVPMWIMALYSLLAVYVHIQKKVRSFKLKMLLTGLLAVSGILLNSTIHVERIYPFLIASGVCLMFIRSYWSGRDILCKYVSKIKSVTEPEVRYLEKALVFWIGLTALNATIFLVFLFAFSTSAWALYASVYSYFVLGAGVFLTWIAGVFYVRLQGEIGSADKN